MVCVTRSEARRTRAALRQAIDAQMNYYVDLISSSESEDELYEWNPNAIRDEILARDMMRIGLLVRSKDDGSIVTFPSPANYWDLSLSPHCDSRTHTLYNDNGMSLRDQLTNQDLSVHNGSNIFRMSSMIPINAPPCHYGYAALNGVYQLRCPICSDPPAFLNYRDFFHHCYNVRTSRYPTQRYPGSSRVFHNEWTNLANHPIELHVAIAKAVKQERKRVVRLFLKEEIVQILRSQPSFGSAPTDVTNHIITLAYQLEDADLANSN